MAKKAKNAKRRPARPDNQPIAVLYHLDVGTRRGDAVRAVLAEQGIRVRTVEESQLASPVGALVGMTGMRMGASSYEGEAPAGEFMLLHNVGSERMNGLLAAMREADASVGCKAQVTQHNRLWPFATLVREVTREHEAMTQGAGQGA